MANGSLITGRSFMQGQDAGEATFNLFFSMQDKIIQDFLDKFFDEIDRLNHTERQTVGDVKRLLSAAKAAKEQAEQFDTAGAINTIKDALGDFYTSDTASDTNKEIVQQAFTKFFDEALTKSNTLNRDSFYQMCDEVIEQCEQSSNEENAAVWDDLKQTITQEFEKAERSRTLLSMEHIECEPHNSKAVLDKLEAAGIKAYFYESQGASPSSIVVPKISDQAYTMVLGAIAESNVAHKEANIISEATMDAIAEFKGDAPRMQMTGLSLEEAEALQEKLYAQNIALVVKPPVTQDEPFSVVFFKENEAYVNSALLEIEMRLGGVGKAAGLDTILQNNYKAKQGVDLLCSQIGEGHNKHGFLIDSEHPEHYLHIDKHGMVEHFADGSKKTITFNDPLKTSVYMRQIHERVMQLSERPLFLTGKEAKELGINEKHYEITIELKKQLSMIKNPENKISLNMDTAPRDPEQLKTYRDKIYIAMNAQTQFARFATEQARVACQQNCSLDRMSQYIEDNIDSLISQYRAENLHKIESRNIPDEKKEEQKQNLQNVLAALRGKLLPGVDIRQEIHGLISDPENAQENRISCHTYEVSQFSVNQLDGYHVTKAEIDRFQNYMASVYKVQNYIPEQPVAEEQRKVIGRENESQARRQARESVLQDKTEGRNELAVREAMERLQSKGLSEQKARNYAVADVFASRMNAAILKGSDLQPEDSFTKMYHYNPEESAYIIGQKFQEKTGISMHELMQMRPSEQKQYSQELHQAIKDQISAVVINGAREIQKEQLRQEAIKEWSQERDDQRQTNEKTEQER